MSSPLTVREICWTSSDLGRFQSSKPHERNVENLFREHNESLVRFLRTRLHSKEEAKEVAQEAYAQLLALKNPEAIDFLQGYLYRTAANLATNRMRQRVQRQRNSGLVYVETEDSRSPERVCEADRDVALIDRALRELPMNCREAFQLVKIDGLSSDETAQRLQLNPRSVRRLVARALAHCLGVLEAPPSNLGLSLHSSPQVARV